MRTLPGLGLVIRVWIVIPAMHRSCDHDSLSYTRGRLMISRECGASVSQLVVTVFQHMRP